MPFFSRTLPLKLIEIWWLFVTWVQGSRCRSGRKEPISLPPHCFKTFHHVHQAGNIFHDDVLQVEPELCSTPISFCSAARAGPPCLVSDANSVCILGQGSSDSDCTEGRLPPWQFPLTDAPGDCIAIAYTCGNTVIENSRSSVWLLSHFSFPFAIFTVPFSGRMVRALKKRKKLYSSE